jgi:hypothetical protein
MTLVGEAVAVDVVREAAVAVGADRAAAAAAEVVVAVVDATTKLLSFDCRLTISFRRQSTIFPG